MFAQLMEEALNQQQQQKRQQIWLHAWRMSWHLILPRGQRLQLAALMLLLAGAAAATTSAVNQPAALLDAAELLQRSNHTAATLAASIDADSLWTVETLVRHAGCPIETHSVTTADGYVLRLQRLPRAGHQPVLLVHGLYGGAVDFVLLGRNASLAYLLWDGAFDVWLVNCRGSSDGRNATPVHTRWTGDDLLYWNFSFHEIGIYDLPAVIDYVRGNTSFHALHYVGHSQGATALLVLAAERAAYQEKLAVVQLLAPLAYFRHTQLQTDTQELIRDFLADPASRGIRAFLPRGSFRQLHCAANKSLRHICLQILYQFVGKDFAELDPARAQLLLAQFPSGGSVKQLRHYHQLLAAGGDQFSHYDYAYEGNHDKYAAATPPAYNLSRVRAPIHVHYAANDPLAAPADVRLLLQQLPRVAGAHLVGHKEFNHLDFVWARNVAALLNRRVLQLLHSSESGEGPGKG